MGGDAAVTLETVQAAALADAHADAESIRTAARKHAHQISAHARGEAAALIAQRRVATERLEDLHRRERLAQARADARATVLQAQRSVLVEAIAAAHTAARRLVGDPRYELLLERLVADAQQRLAAAGEVQIIPVAQGGMIVRAGSRQIDYSLHAQVDRCLEALASELETLWADA